MTTAARVDARRLLTYLWIIFLVRGLFYISFVPLWEGFDEWSHYAAIQNLANGNHLLASRSDPVSKEVQASLQLIGWVPGSADPGGQHRLYWQSSEAERSSRERQLRSIPAQWAREPASGGAGAYEAQQGPLYYWILAPFYKLSANLSFLTRVWLLRLLSVLLASAVIPLGFLVARKVQGEDFYALGVVALIAAMPQVAITASHIANDSLAIALGSLFLIVLFLWKEEPHSMPRSVALGVTLGLALLTKASLLAFIPPVAVFVSIWAKRKNVYRQVLVVAACAMVVSIWWYVRNWILTGTLAGEQIGMGASGSELSLFPAIFKVNWLTAVALLLATVTW